MSRIGKRKIVLSDKVTFAIVGEDVVIKGPKGELKEKLHPHVSVTKNADNQLEVMVADTELKSDRALWGLYNALITNMVHGVTEGFSKQLEINGVGYRAEAKGSKQLILHVGYSHPVEFDIPEGLACAIDKNVITISGIDKKLIGAFAANVREIRKPEPYKGKGIKYMDEHIIRKAGKQAKGATGTK